MDDFIPKFINYSIVISAVILLYMAITPLLAKRYSAKGLYYTWLVIVIALIIPFRPQLGVSINRIYVPDRMPLAVNSPMPSVLRLPAVAATQMESTVVRSALRSTEWKHAASLLWIIGALLFLACNFLRHSRFIKMVNRWSQNVSDEKILMLLHGIKQELGIKRQIGLYLCPYVSSPMMTGLFKPRILLPAANFTKDKLYFIFKHELIHYKRKDLWNKCLMLLAAGMHWFNPTIYLMAKAVNKQCELSCDAEVVSSTDSDTRKRYCETLLEVMKTQSRYRTAISTSFTGGKESMKKRISSILDTGKKKAGLAVICIVLVITAGIGVASAASYSNPKAPADNIDAFVTLKDYENTRETSVTSVRYADSRPQLEFYINGKDIASVEIKCENEYLYAVDLTETQHEKFWNPEYFQTYDEETQTCTFYPERLYDKSIILEFDEDFSQYGDIWYRWTAYNLYKWASENDFSHLWGYGVGPKVEISDDMTEEQKLMLAAGIDGAGNTGLGHIQLDGCPEELTKDVITIIITDRDGNSTTRYIDVEIGNDDLNQTIVTACLRD